MTLQKIIKPPNFRKVISCHTCKNIQYGSDELWNKFTCKKYGNFLIGSGATQKVCDGYEE